MRLRGRKRDLRTWEFVLLTFNFGVMARVPYWKFYIGDWEQDLNACSLETEAAWLRICVKMFKLDKSGVYKTNAERLQRLWKCDAKTMRNVLRELCEENIGRIEEEGDSITFYNRRMIREKEKSTQNSKNAQKRWQKPDNVCEITCETDADSNAKSKRNPEYEYEYEYDNESKGGPGGKIDFGPGGSPVVAVEVLSYLNQLSGMRYDVDASTNQVQIVNLLKSGKTREQMFKVIELKVHQWVEDPEMREHLTPFTLFGPKFDQYYQQSQAITKAKPVRNGKQRDRIRDKKARLDYVEAQLNKDEEQAIEPTDHKDRH